MHDLQNAPEPLLSRIRVVLVEPQHPGNIGAAARAMKNMGLDDLALVAPRRFPDPQASALAAGADDLLARAKVHATLVEAVGDCGLVAATTARNRYLSQPVFTPRQWVQRHRAQPVAGRVALLFGRERTGLHNAELDLCQQLITIPINPDYPSLNLAQAVQVLSYEIRLGSFAVDEIEPPLPPRAVVAAEEMERFYDHLERALTTTGFLDPDHPRLLMRRLRRLFERLEPDANEMNILRGILTSMERGRVGKDDVTNK